MKYLTTVKTIFLTSLFIGFAGISAAQQGPPSPDKKPRKPMYAMRYSQDRGHMFMLPGLTNEQRKQIKDIMLKTRQEVLPIENKVREQEAHLNTLSTAEEVDMNAVNQTIDEIGNLKTSIAKQRAASRQEIRSLLSDEQRVIFDSRKGAFFSHRMRRHFPQPDGKR